MTKIDELMTLADRYATQRQHSHYRHEIEARQELRAALEAALTPGEPVITGAIYDFAGFLTTRDAVIEVGSTANAAPIADLIEEWCQLRDISSSDAMVKDWQNSVTAPPAQTPYFRVIDEELVGAHLGVANEKDTYTEAKAKVNKLITWHSQVATDPTVNGGFELKPAQTPLTYAPNTDEPRHTLPDQAPIPVVNTGAMLRKQHAAIKQLREALQSLTGMAEAFPDELHKDHPEVVTARASLAATEEFK